MGATAEEAKRLAALFHDVFTLDAEVAYGSDAHKLALFERAAGKRYLHLATHGWFAPEGLVALGDREQPLHATLVRDEVGERMRGFAPMTLCGLALAGANAARTALGQADGIVTAEELCSLDLSSCELAVLSACETNVGVRRAGEGIQSLRTAVYAAGARRSLTSLWHVDDQATSVLMAAFYRALWREAATPHEALRVARGELRRAGHPLRDWAAWVLTGAP